MEVEGRELERKGGRWRGEKTRREEGREQERGGGWWRGDMTRVGGGERVVTLLS